MRITRRVLKRLVESYLFEQEEADEEGTDATEDEAADDTGDDAAEDDAGEEEEAEEDAAEEEEPAEPVVKDMKPFPFPIQGTKLKGVVGIKDGKPIARVRDENEKVVLDLNALNAKNPKRARELLLGLFKQAADTLKNQDKVAAINTFFMKVAQAKPDSKDLVRYKKDLNVEISKLKR